MVELITLMIELWYVWFVSMFDALACWLMNTAVAESLLAQVPMHGPHGQSAALPLAPKADTATPKTVIGCDWMCVLVFFGGTMCVCTKQLWPML
jgi:hypothetical protein